jgi:2,3-dihydroxybenzoate decarboxylase
MSVIPPNPNYKRIATEEAWGPPEMFKAYERLLGEGIDDPGFQSLWGFYWKHPSERASFIRARLQDLGDTRLEEMKAAGVDHAVLGLTAPGVQIFQRDEAVEMARYSNDVLAEACRKHPDKYTGMAAVAPQDPAEAAKELERAVTKLGLKACVINSHTHDEYLSDQKFWPILEAAEALDVPIYLHPQGPSRGFIQPLLKAGLDGAVFGFGVDTGFHALSIITSGAFDRFPKLQLCLGHMGEALPFWLYRLDYMHAAGIRAKRYPFMPALKKKVSDYMRENVLVTSSGMPAEAPIRYSQEVLGVDRVMYAMDYPYQYVPEEVTMQDNMAISDEAKKKFFQTNAERVFKIRL